MICWVLLHLASTSYTTTRDRLFIRPLTKKRLLLGDKLEKPFVLKSNGRLKNDHPFLLLSDLQHDKTHFGAGWIPLGGTVPDNYDDTRQHRSQPDYPSLRLPFAVAKRIDSAQQTLECHLRRPRLAPQDICC